MTDASVAAADGFRPWDDDDVAIVTRTNATKASSSSMANEAGHKARLVLSNPSFLCYGIDSPLPISVTEAGHNALREALGEDEDDLVCQHEIGVVRGRLECLNCGQVAMPGRGRYVEREKRR